MNIGASINVAVGIDIHRDMYIRTRTCAYMLMQTPVLIPMCTYTHAHMHLLTKASASTCAYVCACSSATRAAHTYT